MKVLGGRGKQMIFSCSGYSFSPEVYQKEIKSLQGYEVWKVQWSVRNQEDFSSSVHIFLVSHTVTCIWESSFAILLPCSGMAMFWNLWYFSYAWIGTTWAALDNVMWCPFRVCSENPSSVIPVIGNSWEAYAEGFRGVASSSLNKLFLRNNNL